MVSQPPPPLGPGASEACGELRSLVKAKAAPIVSCAGHGAEPLTNLIRQLRIGDCDVSAG